MTLIMSRRKLFGGWFLKLVTAPAHKVIIGEFCWEILNVSSIFPKNLNGNKMFVQDV